ncbi:hypothetical protein N9W57_04565 [Pseudomonadales bacterium]|nr:hypothetical protein [Pseudomonadales bacterium]
MIQLNEILKVDETAEEYISLNQVLSRCAQKQRKLDALVLPNKTELTKTFITIKNNLEKAHERHKGLTFEVRCLLDQHLCDISEGYKSSFTAEVDSLLAAINLYIKSTGTKNESLPQGQYADSVVPIAEAVKKYFPEIPIKSHRNSKFHKIIQFYFEEYLNVLRADYEYIINQALSN